MFLTFLYVTHVSILTFDISSIPHDTPSQTYETLRYYVEKIYIYIFGTCLEPRYIFGAEKQ